MKKYLIVFLLLPFISTFSQNEDDLIQMLKSDIQTDKIAIITQTMNFTDEQSEIFWPIYTDFSIELSKLADKRIANIKSFAANYDSLTADKANELMNSAFDFQDDRLSLNEKYYGKFADALGPIVAAKYMQLEHLIQLILDVQVSANLPFAKSPGE